MKHNEPMQWSSFEHKVNAENLKAVFPTPETLGTFIIQRDTTLKTQPVRLFLKPSKRLRRFMAVSKL